MSEIWLPVVGYEDTYEVSNLGRTRSRPRTVTTSHGHRRRIPAREIKGWIASTGYPQVSLSRDGAKRKESVHVIVAEAFLGPRPTSAHVACHNDGVRTNNSVANLRWDTQGNNLRDAVRHGTHHWAAKTECPKGHPYSPENTYTYQGRRACRACNRLPIRAARKREKRRKAREASK